jgi:hypothetical protein
MVGWLLKMFMLEFGLVVNHAVIDIFGAPIGANPAKGHVILSIRSGSFGWLGKSTAVRMRPRLPGIPMGEALPDLEMMLRVSEQNEVGDSVDVVACRKVARRAE